MKRIYVNEMWCLGCHLCEYYCAYANSGVKDMVKALKDKQIQARITVEQRGAISFAVNCRHCTEPLCVKSCIGGAITSKDGGDRHRPKSLRPVLFLHHGLPLRGFDTGCGGSDAKVRTLHHQFTRTACLHPRLSQQGHRLRGALICTT